jgi:hypothetical protein
MGLLNLGMLNMGKNVRSPLHCCFLYHFAFDSARLMSQQRQFASSAKEPNL